jgi:hypothetical protein
MGKPRETETKINQLEMRHSCGYGEYRVDYRDRRGERERQTDRQTEIRTESGDGK